MRILDSRRLTGPGLLLDRAGAVLDVEIDGPAVDQAIAAWRDAATRMLGAVGWGDERVVARRFTGGASLAITAPPDSLYSATDLNEWAWAAAEAVVRRQSEPEFRAAAERLRAVIAGERNPRLLAIREEARRRGLTFLSGEGAVSVGAGTGVISWRMKKLPAPERIDWSRAHEIPVALVTGSNGKTTVVRLLGAMAAAAGRVTGLTSTEGVVVGGRLVKEGDYSGPEGARRVLRRAEVDTAILETARGGLLRRGLSVERADIAVVTNVAADHLGEFGVQDLRQLAETKLLVARAIGPGGRVVLNADDPVLIEASAAVRAPIVWFSLDAGNTVIRRHTEGGGTAAVVDGDALVLVIGSEREGVARVAEMPLAAGGAARHNVANALAATAAAGGLDIPLDVVRATLRRFGRDPADNPGRANVYEVGGIRIVVDYAHNPHGMAALAATLDAMPSERRLVMIGQAGDRDDAAIRELARAALALRPDRVVVKEMDAYLRGRAPGEVPALMADELRRAGLPEGAISVPGTEIPAVREALGWARPGDLLVLTLHQERRRVAELLETLRRQGWRAGEPLSS
ncbi:MAG TPA: Mur ligase family protein [Gemmatimonadales bacterium]|nr:Mur ligase family protein [Gemmatimonadales bacterium]